VDLCSAKLNKGHGLRKQMSRPPFIGSWAVAFGDGFTDEAMFSVVNCSIKVGNESSRAEERLGGHEQTLDVLEWLIELSSKPDIIECCQA
jgi:trehalose-6-phosphatase